jgi:hypothetical protein
MKPDPRKNPGEGEPIRGEPSESGATMKSAPTGSDFDPRRFGIEDLGDPNRAEEALTHWDELDPALLTAIAAHPQHGPRLAMLRRADRWIEAKAPSLRPAGACPSSEELYDFGRGPGFLPMESARRGEIERHLRTCRDCENLVETLAVMPPVPIATGVEAESKRVAREVARPRLRALPRLLPLAAAASLVVGLGLWIAFSTTGSESVRFPTAPLLRGSSGGPLFFPRDRVLHATQEVRAAFPALDGKLVFEVEAQAEATSYKIDVAKHGGDVFAADEGSVLKLSETIPGASAAVGGRSGATSANPPASIHATAELAPGQYTWSARATVHGLDQELGQRDFSVVDDAEIDGKLIALGSQSEPKRSLAAVKLLHEAGFLGEARAIARAMPASPERDAYLSQLPGR